MFWNCHSVTLSIYYACRLGTGGKLDSAVIILADVTGILTARQFPLYHWQGEKMCRGQTQELLCLGSHSQKNTVTVLPVGLWMILEQEE